MIIWNQHWKYCSSYIKMHSDHKRYCVIPGDLCKYTLKCFRCDTCITPPGTIGVTLYHAPVAILET